MPEDEVPKWKQNRDALAKFFEKLKPRDGYTGMASINVDLMLESQHPELSNVGHALTEGMFHQQATLLRQIEASISLTMSEDPELEFKDLELRIGTHIEVWARGEPKYHIYHLTVADTHEAFKRFDERSASDVKS